MTQNFFTRRKILKESNYLDLTPFRIHREEIDENGLVTILVPKFTNKFVVKYIVPTLKSKYFKIHFDELGSETWKLIDGKINVNNISESLLAKFGDKIQPVHERVTKFLSQLYLQGFISFNELKNKGE